MKVFQIKAAAEKGNVKAQFVLSQIIGSKKSIHFKNIDDAKRAMSLAAAKLPIKCKFVERNI